MSVYLGQDKVGFVYHDKAHMYEDQRSIMQDDVYTPWTRPAGWPNLDSLGLTLTGINSFVYMTYRTGHDDDVCSFGVATASGSATIELGTISNGTFTATTTETLASGNIKTYIFSSTNGYSDGTIVVKVTGRFTKFYLSDYTNNGVTIKYYMQPLLERIWYVPEMTHFYNGSSGTTTGNGSLFLQRDKIGNDEGTSLVNMYNAWYYCSDLQSLDISKLYTQNVTTMQQAFYFCKKLESLDIAHFDTSKVTTLYFTFGYCHKVRELDLSTWNTTKLTGNGLADTFYGCYALKEIKGLKDFYVNNITSLVSLFNGCLSLQNAHEVSGWNVSNVTNIASMFLQCAQLKFLDLSNWNIGKVTSIVSLFSECRNLEHILFPQVQTSTLSGSISYLFQYCFNLQEVDLTWIKPITSAVTSMAYLFWNCQSLVEINIPEGWDVTGCTASESFYRIFGNCYKLQKITGISNWDVSGYKYSFNQMFMYDYCLKELNIKNWCPHPTTMYQAFDSCSALEELDLTGWNWEKMTSTALYFTFNGCHSLKTISGIESMGSSGNITSFQATFQSCYSLSSLPNINSWDPAKVTTCANMFTDCRALKSLTITNWTMTKCTTIANMFRYCYSMVELDLSGWTLPALTTNPDYIFSEMWCLQKNSGLPIGLNHKYTNNRSLPEDQWARIFTQLPTVSGKTINMTTENINRLSATTKAIATEKGWTLAN